MSERNWKALLALTAAVLAIASFEHTFAQESEQADATRATMHQVFEALVKVLPRTLQEGEFESPAERELIRSELEQLAGAASALQIHAPSHDAGFAYLSRSLAEDARSALRRFTEGHDAAARFTVQHLTDTCITCHSRLPAAREFPLAARLLDTPSIRELPPRQRARLQSATRHFDESLATYEAVFKDPNSPAVTLDVGGDLVDYLTISIRVKRDLARPRTALQKLSKRRDLPTYFRRILTAWVESLDELATLDFDAPSPKRARKLVERASGMRDYAVDRTGVVYDLAASSLLHAYIEANREPSAELAEAYYLIGITDAWTQRGYHVSEASFALKTAIRMAPKSDIGRSAYSLLEEYTILDYSGSGGTNIPPDVQSELDSLRRLVEEPASRT